MAKVSDLLRLPAFRGIHVLSGENGLQRKVEHVTVMEVPDIKRWLKGNDFLITSFYSVRKSEEAQCRLIEDLADTCCCVAVKTGQYVNVISERVKETADRCSLPLLEIPFETPYIDLLMNVMNLIFEEENTASILEKYVKDIIYENYTDEILMAERGRLFGFEADEDYFSAVNICFRKKYIPSEQEKKAIRFLCQTLQRCLLDSGSIQGCPMIRLEKGFLLLAEAKEAERLEQYLENYLDEDYLKKIWKAEGKGIVCGVGPVKKGLKGIRDSYSLSFKAMKVGYTLSRNQLLYFYKKLEPYCELEKILVSPSEHVFTSVLGAVKNQELLDTLVMYYECGANMERVSDRMYTHKNTVKYRLNRLQELTGLDLRNPDDNFRLYLAVLALKMNFKISF